MRLFKNIMLFAAVATALFTSCETDVDTPQISTPESFVAPVLGQCNDIIVNADNSANENVIFTWTAADFGLPVQILYSVYLTSGENSALLGTSSTTSYAISKGDLNGVVINGLGVAANETATVSAYVTAKMYGTDNYEPIASAVSNKFSVTTYSAPLTSLYLCGEFSGSWDINNAPIFWETTAGSNTYACMVDFSKTAAGDDATRSFFKVVAQQAWSGDNWGYNDLTPSWHCPEQNDANLSLPFSEGNIFEITVNKSVMTIDKKAIGNKLGLTGDFNNWGEGTPDATFTYDYLSSSWKTEPIALEAGKSIKVRVDGAWTTNWGATGTMSTVVAGGYELEAGKDNISVPETGTYIVVFHGNRTPYVLELVKQ